MLIAALLLAQTAPQQCTAMDAALPAPLAGWTAPGEQFTVGKAVTMAAADRTSLQGLPDNGKAGGAAIIGFKVDAAGSYGVALDQPGWIDVTPIAGGEPLKSVKHGHGPECSTIRKIVRFDLQPGVYRLTLTGLTKPAAKAMLVAPE